jgi:hypothetical protein
MRKVLTAVALVCTIAAPSFADNISVYGDAAGNQCFLSGLVSPPAQNAFYIVHKLNAGSTAAQFKVTDTSGLFAASQNTPYLSIGTWNTDLSLAYGGCVIGNHVVMTLNFFWFGGAPNCNQKLTIDPAPASPIPGSIALVDCALPSGNLEAATGGSGYMSPACAGQCAVATQSTTWGSVKALYK